MEYHAYKDFLQMDVRDSIGLIEDISKQKLMDRQFLEYATINAIRCLAGEELLDFRKDIVGNIPNTNNTNTTNMEEIKEKYSVANRKKVLNSLL